MPESVSQAGTTLVDAERLMQGGNFEQAAEMLENAVEAEPTIEALYLLATSYLELGEHDKALHYASAAVEKDSSSAPATDLRAKVNLALGQYDSALSDYIALADLCREQRQPPPDSYPIPAHFALHNIEQLDHILTMQSR